MKINEFFYQRYEFNRKAVKTRTKFYYEFDF